jgi:uncharacterized protein YkwD
MAILSVVVLSLVVLLPSATLAQDGPTSAELRSAETLVMRLINQERSAVGLRAIRTDGRIRTVAQARSRDMVDRGYFDHVDPDGKLPWDHLDDAHITWYGAGEIIAWNTVSPIDAAAAKAVSQWMHSTSGHREQILSTEHNYAGVGVATDGARSIWTVVFIQGPDRTDPIAALTRASSAQGSAAISLAWSGSDPLLVTRTAGIASFDLARRKPGGTWTTIKSATTRTSLTLTASAGARYQFRVRARDKAGNVGDWSATRDVTVR